MHLLFPIAGGLSSIDERSPLTTKNLERIITHEGGVIAGEDILLRFPPGAVGCSVYVQVAKEDPSKYYGSILQKDLENDVRVCAPIIKLQPCGYRFMKPVTLSVNYRLSDFKCEDFLILHGTEARDGNITWQDVTKNASIVETPTNVEVTIEITSFSIYETLLRLTPYIRPKDILMRLNLLAFSYKMSVFISSKQNELALLFVSQDVYNETFYRSHETSALVQLRAQGFTEVHVRSIGGVQDEKRVYNSESFHVSICLGEDYKFVDSQNSSFHFAVASYVWWNTGHVIKIPLEHTKDVRILCGKISVEGQYGHSSERHFCESGEYLTLLLTITKPTLIHYHCLHNNDSNDDDNDYLSMPIRGVARGRSWGARPCPLCEITVLCSYNSGDENAQI